MKRKGGNEGFLTYGMAATAIAVGVCLLGVVFAISTSSGWRKGNAALDDGLEFIKLQCGRYDDMVSSDEASTQVQLVDKANELRNHLSENAASQLNIDSFAKSQRLSGVIVTDSGLDIILEFSTESTDSEGYGSVDWQQVVNNDNIAQIIAYPQKNYAARLQCEDGTIYDYVVTSLNEGNGVILCYLRQPESKSEEQKQWLQNLLSGYRLDMNGTMSITDGQSVISSNNDESVGVDVVEYELEYGDATDISTEKSVVVSIDGTRYMAKAGRFRDYCLYVLFPISEIYSQRSMAVAYVLVFYIFCLMLLLMFRQREQNTINRQKMDFLHQVSHDIRTPINGIRGMVMIGDSMPENLEKQAECRRKIWEASELLIELVNDVLDIGRLENGDVKLEKKPFDIVKLLDNEMTFMGTQAKSRGLKLVTDRVECPHAMVLGSPFHVRRILDNIISNAIKYNNEGGSVTVSVVELDDFAKDGRRFYRFICRDTGIGMSHEFQKHMFERFTQERTSGEQAHHGTGLGLAIVNELVLGMGGTIRCESEQGKGTCFYVTLPFVQMQGGRNESDVTAGEVDGYSVGRNKQSATADKVDGHSGGMTQGEPELIRDAKTGGGMSGGEMSAGETLAESGFSRMMVAGDAELLDSSMGADGCERCQVGNAGAYFDDAVMADGTSNSLEGISVLLVEDNELNMEIAEFLLEDEGMLVTKAWDGSEAVEIFRKSIPGQIQVILMDIMMPVMDGKEAAHAIRKLDRSDATTVPIIAMTANAFAEDVEESLKAGMNAHLSKPIDVDKLKSEICRCVFK